MRTEVTGLPDRLTLFAFAGTVFIAGLNFVAVKFSNEELEPFFGGGVRFFLASLLFFAFVALRRVPLPRGRALVGTVIYGVIGFSVFYGLAYWALQELTAGIAGVVVASVPLLTLFLAALHRLEPITARGIGGSILAIAGIAILVGAPSDVNITIPGFLAMLGAAVCAAESGVILKLFPPDHLVATNAVSMGIGAVLLFVLSAFSGETWVVPANIETRVAILYLVVLGSVALFAFYLFTLKRWTASGVSYQFVIIPIVSVIAAALILNETITLGMIAGGVIVLAGVYIGVLSGHGKRAATDTAETEQPCPPHCA